MFMGFSPYQEFVADSLDEYEHKQEKMARVHGIGCAQSSWALALDMRTLSVFHGDLLTAECDVIPIGEYYGGERMWLWSWANRGVDGRLRKRAARLQRLAKSAGMPDLALARLCVHRAMVLELVAMSCRELDLLGVYPVPWFPDRTLYVGVEEVRRPAPLRVVRN
jgi:hypothetical protein